MTIHRGTRPNSNNQGTNFTHKAADIRLAQIAKASKQKQLNALKVDGLQAIYYQKVIGTQVCTCKRPKSNPVSALPSMSDSFLENDIYIDYSRPLFGGPSQVVTEDLDSEDLDDWASDEVEDHILGPNTACGLCYQVGYSPGYSKYGSVRLVLDTHCIEYDTVGYTIDNSSLPASFIQVDENGSVSFLVEIPSYFKSVSYSIRDNQNIVEDPLFNVLGEQLSLSYLKANEGTTIEVVCSSSVFTHVVLEFDFDTSTILVNCSQMNKNLDWTKFSTLSNLNFVLPSSIAEVSSSDILVIPSRGIVAKVTDIPYQRTAGDVTFDWSCSTRVLQPQEPLKNIHKLMQIF